MKRFVYTILPHCVLVLGEMYVVFYILDAFNPTMDFVANSITQFLMLLLALSGSLLAVATMALVRKKRGKKPAERDEE